MKVLMVCLGNICRSPVAEGVLRKLATDKGLNIEIDSAGTAGYHVGSHPDRRSTKNAKKNGVDISNLVARKFSVNDFDNFDRIYALDANNLREIHHLARNEEDKKKTDLLLNILFPAQNKAVPDPYYGFEKDFEEVFQLIHAACDKITDELIKELK